MKLTTKKKFFKSTWQIGDASTTIVNIGEKESFQLSNPPNTKVKPTNSGAKYDYIIRHAYKSSIRLYPRYSKHYRFILDYFNLTAF